MKMERIGMLIGLSIFPLLGLLLIGIGARNIWRGAASSQWPVAKATVNSLDTQAWGSSSANLVFRYSVGGRRFSTDRISFGESVGTGTAADADLRRFRFPLGSAITVRYDPKDPSMAAVEPGFHSEVLWLPGAGLAFPFPGLMFLLVFVGDSGGGGSMKYGLTMFAAIFLLAGFGLLCGGLTNLWRGYSSRHWPATEGRIVYGSPDPSVPVPEGIAEASADRDSELIRASGSGSQIVYRYEVQGRKHFANMRLFGEVASSGSEWTAETSARYALGKTVRVAYSQADPDIAVLETGITNTAYILPGAGAAVLLFGLAVLLFGVPALTRD